MAVRFADDLRRFSVRRTKACSTNLTLKEIGLRELEFVCTMTQSEDERVRATASNIKFWLTP